MSVTPVMWPRTTTSTGSGRAERATLTRRDREIQLFPTLHPAAILRRRTEMLPLMESDFDALSVLLAGSG